MLSLIMGVLAGYVLRDAKAKMGAYVVAGLAILLLSILLTGLFAVFTGGAVALTMELITGTVGEIVLGLIGGVVLYEVVARLKAY